MRHPNKQERGWPTLMMRFGGRRWRSGHGSLLEQGSLAEVIPPALGLGSVTAVGGGVTFLVSCLGC